MNTTTDPRLIVSSMRGLLNEIDTACRKAVDENDFARWTKLNDAKHAISVAMSNLIRA